MWLSFRSLLDWREYRSTRVATQHQAARRSNSPSSCHGTPSGVSWQRQAACDCTMNGGRYGPCASACKPPALLSEVLAHLCRPCLHSFRRGKFSCSCWLTACQATHNRPSNPCTPAVSDLAADFHIAPIVASSRTLSRNAPRWRREFRYRRRYRRDFLWKIRPGLRLNFGRQVRARTGQGLWRVVGSGSRRLIRRPVRHRIWWLPGRKITAWARGLVGRGIWPGRRASDHRLASGHLGPASSQDRINMHGLTTP